MSVRPIPGLATGLGRFLEDCGATIDVAAVAENRLAAATSIVLGAIGRDAAARLDQSAQQIAEMIGFMVMPPQKLEEYSASIGSPAPPQWNYHNLSDDQLTTFDGRACAIFNGKYTVGGANKYVGIEIASRVRALIDYAHGQGVNLQISEAERDYNTQLLYYTNYLAGRGPIAAAPDASNHRKGKAVDFNLLGTPGMSAEKVYRWLKVNAPRFGLNNTFKPGEDDVHWSTTGR